MSAREEADIDALINWPEFVAIDFDAGTTFALTQGNIGHWTEGSPTHVPIGPVQKALDLHKTERWYRGSAFAIDPIMDGWYEGCKICKTDGPCATRLLLSEAIPG